MSAARFPLALVDGLSAARIEAGAIADCLGTLQTDRVELERETLIWLAAHLSSVVDRLADLCRIVSPVEVRP